MLVTSKSWLWRHGLGLGLLIVPMPCRVWSECQLWRLPWTVQIGQISEWFRNYRRLRMSRTRLLLNCNSLGILAHIRTSATTGGDCDMFAVGCQSPGFALHEA